MGTIIFILILAVIFGSTLFLTNKDHKKRKPTEPIMTSNKVQVIIKDGNVKIYNENGGEIELWDFYEYVKKKNNIKNVKSEIPYYQENMYGYSDYSPHIYLKKGNYYTFVFGWDKISHCKTAEEVIPVLQKMEKEIVDWYNSIPQETKTIKI
jgi:hypothetical protein